MNNTQSFKYKLLAYYTVRDALGFYFGIPKFLNNFDKEQVIENKLQDKIKNKEVTEKQIEKYRRLITKSVNARITFLEEDYEFCKEVLFTKNLWLELLDIDPVFFKAYLGKLSPKAVDELSIVPNWTMRDESLRRPYLTAELNIKNLKLL